MTGKDEQNNTSASSERRVRTREIGKKLRQIYDDVAKEDVPREFLDLLEQADRESASRHERTG